MMILVILDQKSICLIFDSIRLIVFDIDVFRVTNDDSSTNSKRFFYISNRIVNFNLVCYGLSHISFGMLSPLQLAMWI